MVSARTENKRPYVGRFAPSPTGALHFGSMLAAVASFVRARSESGRWLVRIEDIDPPREVPGAADAQLATLRRHGLVPDAPVTYQRNNARRHAAAVQRLRAAGRAFECGCSRRELPADGRYPGTCRQGIPPGRTARSIRFRVDDAPVCFPDGLRGAQAFHLADDPGDFVIRRADGLMAYQLAVAVDDAAEGITEVVRGSDLLDSTPRQIAIQQALGLASPAWQHLPLAVDENGDKLSKSRAADPVDRDRPAETLRLVLRALGHEPPTGCRTPESILDRAARQWDPARIPPGPVAVGVHPADR